ncbi:photosynthetic complex putative assembly protein PuhB [Acuticoccus sp.]|uniref:photosynthetic complex putative assembly protein PuhB n=1 Tax=Acuticoccus sp. TaxID=1904378 RepID=UPI003B52B645
MNEDIHVEAIRGLPEPLPAGERLLWQGSPDWRALAIEVFHVRAVCAYALVLIAWRWATILHDGGTHAEAAIVALWLLLLPVVACAILAGLAALTAGATVYTITDQRVVMRIGVALTVTFNLPYTRIASAAYKRSFFGCGEIPLTIAGKERVSYLVLWPHARPFLLKNPQPMLRAVPDGERVANLLARALAIHAHQSARSVAPEDARATEPVNAGSTVLAS